MPEEISFSIMFVLCATYLTVSFMNYYADFNNLHMCVRKCEPAEISIFYTLPLKTIDYPYLNEVIEKYATANAKCPLQTLFRVLINSRT